MNDNETIADIIAEKRFDATTRDQFDSAYIVDLCDRLEAAHKREVREAVTDCNQFSDAAKLREALKAIGGLCAGLMPTWDGAVGRIKDMAETALAAPATDEKSSAIGNAAKLREALESCLDTICRIVWIDDPVYDEDGHYLGANYAAVSRDKARAALAAPPRNCDRFATVDEARKAHEAICEKYGKCHNGCPLNNEEHYSAFDCFEAWLFAPSTETEGGAK